jgi:hypothetical protein
MLSDDTELADRINELLIHCRYGLKYDPKEGWVKDSSHGSCKVWVSLAHRAVHEAICPHQPDSGSSSSDGFCVLEEDELLEFQPDDEFEPASDTYDAVTPVDSPLSTPPRSPKFTNKSLEPPQLGDEFVPITAQEVNSPSFYTRYSRMEPDCVTPEMPSTAELAVTPEFPIRALHIAYPCESKAPLFHEDAELIDAAMETPNIQADYESVLSIGDYEPGIQDTTESENFSLRDTTESVPPPLADSSKVELLLLKDTDYIHMQELADTESLPSTAVDGLDDASSVFSQDEDAPSLILGTEEQVIPQLHVCPNNFHGCEFVASSEASVHAHFIVCKRNYMEKIVDDLVATLQAKEAEIANLKAKLAQQQAYIEQPQPSNLAPETQTCTQATQVEQDNTNHENDNNAPHASGGPSLVVSPPDFYISLAKGLNLLETEGQRALDEAVVVIKKTKAIIKRRSSVVLAHIKKSLGEAHEELVYKFRALMQSLESSDEARVAVPQPAQQEEDAELRQVIQESEAAFKEESKLRANEEDQVNQAILLSLMD